MRRELNDIGCYPKQGVGVKGISVVIGKMGKRPAKDFNTNRFILYMFNTQSYRMIIMITALAIGTMLEGIGITMLIPLLSLISRLQVLG